MLAQPARILLADDHALVRSGLRMILDAEHDLQVVAEAADGHEALALLEHTPADLAILDIAMPRMTGLQAAREMNRSHSHVRILMLSMYDNEQYFFAALKAGADMCSSRSPTATCSRRAERRCAGSRSSTRAR
jgi:DNA-binding NarL/FixJ family response regulator